MVTTPWGSPESLRDRRLSPGRGTPPEEVARNQRERLFAAMVATVAEKGYEATTVADLLALSGVSRATFYEHFADKEECFVATLEAVVEPALAAVSAAARSPAPRPLRRGLEAFVSLLGAQPAAARLCFVEAHCAGPGALAVLERAFDAFAALAGEALERVPDRAGMPAELVRPIVGGFWQVIQRRVYREEAEALGALLPGLWEWGLSYPPPPSPLRAPRRRRATPRRTEAYEEEAERIMRAFAECVCERGYASATVSEATERASCSFSTFYAHFPGKEEAMLAALDSGSARMLAAMLPSYRRAGEWPQAMRQAIAAMFAFGAADPTYAQLGATEVFAAGTPALLARDGVLRSLGELLAPGFELAPAVPPIAAEAIGGAILALAYDRVRSGGPASLPAAAPLATYITLTPFLGAAAAVAEANRRR